MQILIEDSAIQFEAKLISRDALTFLAVESKPNYWKPGRSRETQLLILSCCPATLFLPGALISSYFEHLMTILQIYIFFFLLHFEILSISSFWVSHMSGRGRSLFLWQVKDSLVCCEQVIY